MSSNKAFVQHPAPDFSATALVDGDFKEVSLSDYKDKYLILFFYPLDFSFVCPTELISFSNRAVEFRQNNCEIVACSTDSEYSHLAWSNIPRKRGGVGEMQFPILADKSHKISKDYGVLVDSEGIALRGLFIISDKGILRHISINDFAVGRSVDEALRLVKAFQFVDLYGEVCPANWQPGSDAIKPTTVGSLDYFRKH